METIFYQEYIAKTEANLVNNPQQFWKHVQNTNGSSGIPDNVYWGSRRSQTGDDIVNLFSEYFSTVYSNNHYVIPEYYFKLPKCIDVTSFFVWKRYLMKSTLRQKLHMALVCHPC